MQLLHKDTTPCNASATLGNYAIYAPSVVTPNHAQSTAPAGTVVVTPAANTSATITTLLAKGPNDSAALIPAGTGGVGYEDRPINYALVDAQGGRDRGDGRRHGGEPDVPQHGGRADYGW